MFVIGYLKITGVSQDVDVKLYANTYASESTVPYTETLNQIGDPVTVENPIFSRKFQSRCRSYRLDIQLFSKTVWVHSRNLRIPGGRSRDLILYNGKEATVIEANINFNQGAMRETFIREGGKNWMAVTTPKMVDWRIHTACAWPKRKI